jgi:hypothetical protein
MAASTICSLEPDRVLAQSLLLIGAGKSQAAMHIVLALIFIGICLAMLGLALWRPGVKTVFCAAVALFSLGYFGLPMLLIERSTLRYLPEAELAGTIGMALLFLLAWVAGMLAHSLRGRGGPGLALPQLDQLLERYWWAGAIASNAVIIAYGALRTQTFYQVASVDDFVAGRSSFEGILGFASGLAQALAAAYLVAALYQRNKARIGFAGAGVLIQVLLVLGAGQRLIIITPVLLVMAAMVARQNFRLAGATLGAGIALMLVVSPFAVAVRTGAWNNTQDLQAESFSYGEDPIETMLQSIVDRGDILQNTATLKAHVDANGVVGPTYYLSVLAIPIPRIVYRSKPYVLSDTGTIDGEASVLAWRLTVGPTLGSLTAFGSIIAYREGGWLWVPINGFLTGFLMSVLLSWFQRGGFVGQAFFCLAFFNWSIRKVPPSLMEVMVDVMTYLPVILGLYVINRLLEGETRAAAPVAAQTAQS